MYYKYIGYAHHPPRAAHGKSSVERMTLIPSSSSAVNLYIKYAIPSPNAMTTAPCIASGMLRRRRSGFNNPARASRQSSIERRVRARKRVSSRTTTPRAGARVARAASMSTNLSLRSVWRRTWWTWCARRSPLRDVTPPLWCSAATLVLIRMTFCARTAAQTTISTELAI